MRYRCSTLAVLLLVFLAANYAASAQDAYKRVADRIVCQCGCHYPLDSCPHTDCPWAPKVRGAIRAQLAADKSEQEVLAGLVAQYGQVILAAPPPEGFNLLGWVMPFGALLAGLWLVRLVLLRWRRRQPARAGDPALLSRYRHAAEEELKHLEES